jgi:hypothetical protein
MDNFFSESLWRFFTLKYPIAVLSAQIKKWRIPSRHSIIEDKTDNGVLDLL